MPEGASGRASGSDEGEVEDIATVNEAARSMP